MTTASVERTDDVRVIHVDGHASDDDVSDLRRLLTTDRQLPTILDLSDLVLAGDRLASVVDRLVDACGPVCIVVRRATAGLILERLGVARRCPVFQSAGDALQALRMADEGYGPGWTGRDRGGNRGEGDGTTDHERRLGNGSREPDRPVVPSSSGR